MSDCCRTKKTKNTHPDHAADLPRLNRIGGQVDGIKKMIEEKRYCPDIMVQLRAIRSALKSVEANILERHLAACVTDAMHGGGKKEQSKKLDEIKELFKRFDD